MNSALISTKNNLVNIITPAIIIISVDLFGLHKLNETFGMVGFFRGVANMIGIPWVGLLFDFTHSYKIPFVVSGATMILSCFIGTVAHFIHTKKQCDIKAVKEQLSSIQTSQAA